MDFAYSQREAKLKERVRDFARKRLSPIAQRVDSIDEYSPEVIELL